MNTEVFHQFRYDLGRNAWGTFWHDIPCPDWNEKNVPGSDEIVFRVEFEYKDISTVNKCSESECRRIIDHVLSTCYGDKIPTTEDFKKLGIDVPPFVAEFLSACCWREARNIPLALRIGKDLYELAKDEPLTDDRTWMFGRPFVRYYTYAKKERVKVCDCPVCNGDMRVGIADESVTCERCGSYLFLGNGAEKKEGDGNDFIPIDLNVCFDLLPRIIKTEFDRLMEQFKEDRYRMCNMDLNGSVIRIRDQSRFFVCQRDNGKLHVRHDGIPRPLACIKPRR